MESLDKKVLFILNGVIT